MILDSVGKCDVDVRRDLYSGIILTGATSDSLLPLASSSKMLHVITKDVVRGSLLLRCVQSHKKHVAAQVCCGKA